MKVTNTNELSQFITELKEWAIKHSYENIVSAIDAAEKSSYTASELIIKYGETLRALKKKMPASLPATFKDNWDAAVEVAIEAVQTVEYPEKRRSLFSLN